MTEIQFHTGVAEPLVHVMKLLRKAEAQGARLAVLGPAALLDRISQHLWSDDPQSFRPHLRLGAGQPPGPHLAPTPVWLVERLESVPADVDRLLHLAGETAEAPPGFERFARLYDIVGADPASRLAGRQRWRHYADRGYALSHHPMDG